MLFAGTYCPFVCLVSLVCVIQLIFAGHIIAVTSCEALNLQGLEMLLMLERTEQTDHFMLYSYTVFVT